MVSFISDSFPIEVSDEINNWQLLILMGLDILMTCDPGQRRRAPQPILISAASATVATARTNRRLACRVEGIVIDHGLPTRSTFGSGHSSAAFRVHPKSLGCAGLPLFVSAVWKIKAAEKSFLP
jgi:hypothetical protein